MVRTFLAAVMFLTVWGSALSAQGTVYVLDDFDTSAVGQPPLDPAVGSRYLTGSSHLVTEHSGTRWLETIDNSTTAGPGAEWVPHESVTDFRWKMRSRIPSMSPAGQVVYQVVLLTPTSTEVLYLLWSGDGGIDFVGAGLVLEPGTWSVGAVLQVGIEVSCSTDTFAVSFNGSPLISEPLGYDCVTLQGVHVGTRRSGTQTHQVDEVLVEEIEPPLFVDGFETGDTSAWSPTPPPAWNQCGTAPWVGGVPNQYVYPLTNNTPSGVVDSCGGGTTSVDGWFRYLAPCTGEVVFTTCHQDTDFDTVVSVWSDCPAQTELNCNDDDVSGSPACDLNGASRKSTTYFNVMDGDTVYLRVRSYLDTPDPGSQVHFSVTCNPFTLGQ